MSNEGFFHRWSRLKGATDSASAERDGTPAPPRAAGAPPSAPPDARMPTLRDVALLGADSDYAPFVAPGVDPAVRRGAMKKLFSDPHFKVGDGLDIFMADYNLPDPVSAAMLAALQHSQGFFAQAAAVTPQETPDQPAVAPDERVAGEGAGDDGTAGSAA